MTKNNKGNLFVFEVGPSVKFVSAIKDAIFNKKIGVNFVLQLFRMVKKVLKIRATIPRLNMIFVQLCLGWQGVSFSVEKVDGVEQTQEDFSPMFSIVTGRGQAG